MNQSEAISIDNISVVELGCCRNTGISEPCVEFEGGKHRSEVNLCNYVEDGPVIWRLECSSCATVLKIFKTYDEAILAGKQHAVDPKTYFTPWFGIYDEEE